MDAELLREFVTIADQGSLTKAAKKLLISQPTLSKHLAALEKELGVRLLDRDATKTLPTPAGEGFLPLAREVVLAYDRAMTWVSDVRRSKPARLVVELFEGFKVTDDIASLLKVRLAEAFPNVVLEVRDISGGDPLDDLRQMDCDLVFAALRGGTDLSGLGHLSVRSEPLVAIVNHRHRLACRESVCLADFDGETIFTADEGGINYFGLLRDLFSNAGVSVVERPIPWVNSHEWRCRAAKDEHGVTFDFESTAWHDLPLMLCKILRIEDCPDMDMQAIWRLDDPNVVLMNALEIIGEAVERQDMSIYR